MDKVNCYCGKPKKENRNKYCSLSCGALARWNNPDIRAKYVMSMKTRKPNFEIICPCGVTVRFNEERKKYCSKKCFYKYRIKVIPSNFKGENVGYDALHDWVQRHLGKATFCSFNSNHKARRYHWANKSHDYLRDLEDYMSLCPKCHSKYDEDYKGAKERRFAQ